MKQPNLVYASQSNKKGVAPVLLFFILVVECETNEIEVGTCHTFLAPKILEMRCGSKRSGCVWKRRNCVCSYNMYEEVISRGSYSLQVSLVSLVICTDILLFWSSTKHTECIYYDFFACVCVFFFPLVFPEYIQRSLVKHLFFQMSKMLRFHEKSNRNFLFSSSLILCGAYEPLIVRWLKKKKQIITVCSMHVRSKYAALNVNLPHNRYIKITSRVE